MIYVESYIDIFHECPLCEVSLKYPEILIYLWRNDRRDIIQMISPSEAMMSDAILDLENLTGTDGVIKTGRYALAISRTCVCEPTRMINTYADELSCWLVPPTVFRMGMERHHVISRTREAVRNFVGRTETDHRVFIESILEKEDLTALVGSGTSSVDVLDDLTDKQLEVLISAYENGLLDIPSKGNMEKVAKSLGITHSTYGEHLHKGIYSMVRRAYPYMKYVRTGKR